MQKAYLFSSRPGFKISAGFSWKVISSMMLKRIPFEGLFWLAGLLILAFADMGSAGHFTLCPLKNLGFDFCPGCGLGRSVSLLFHGEILRSIDTHPLGIFAVITLSFRIINLTKQSFQNYGKSY